MGACRDNVNFDIEGEWRENSLAFKKYLNKIDESPYKEIEFESIKMIYIDSLNNAGPLNIYLNNYIDIFCKQIKIDSKNCCLVFLPLIEDYKKQKRLIDYLLNKLEDRETLLLYREKSYNDLISRDIIQFNHYRVTYNSRLVISEYSNINDYFSSLTSKRRRYLLRCSEVFENQFEDLEFHKFSIKEYEADVIRLYSDCCIMHNDAIESDKFLNNLDQAEMVDWYGIFYKGRLSMFSGYWKNTHSVILGMFGKDYEKEQILRDSYAYYYLNLKMIEVAINHGINVIYNSYGEENMKKQMGYEIDYYSIMFKKTR